MHWKLNSIVPACARFLCSLRSFITVADKFVDSNLFFNLQFDSCDKLAPTNDPPINFIAAFNQIGGVFFWVTGGYLKDAVLVFPTCFFSSVCVRCHMVV